MKLYNRILSTLLAVMMLLGAFSIGIAAEEATEEEKAADIASDKVIESTYVSTVYNTPEEKLDTMDLMLSRDNYELYVDSVSGEVATKDTITGQILFSNPYDVVSSQGSDSTKKQILSQIVVQYIDNGTTKYLYSFEEAAMRQQINVLNIKNGIRVEYTIGREESRKLVPRWISDESFVKYIQTPLKAAVEKEELDEFYYKKFMTYYKDQRLADKKSKKAKEQLLLAYPICEEMDIWVFATDASSVEINWCEERIKAFCEDYTFEQMDADHEETGYEAKDEKYPLFKMALEYSLDANGLNVVLPANGLRYDMSTYTLEYVSILPYMGAGNSQNAGLVNEATGEKHINYNFYPDGSGSLFDFEQLNTKSTTTVRGKVYGIDYAYHQITGTYQKAIRYPVYGTVSTERIYTFTFSSPYQLDENLNVMTKDKKPIELAKPEEHTVTLSNTVMTEAEIKEFVKERNGSFVTDITVVEEYDRGYVAVIEEGESLAEIATYHAGSLSDYNTMMNYFNPKPKDSYDIADSISVTSSSSWTVVSERKYTGNIKIHYQLLTDKYVGEEKQKEIAGYTYYDTTWLGMAEAYRDYLVKNGTLTKLTAEETESNIPLYIEVFGALETQQTIMTVPVDVMTPLTTFQNVEDIYNALSSEQNNITNINFKLTGFANGGMYATVPAKLKWEKAVGGADGFEKLIAAANAASAQEGKNFGLFPDFDFAYIHQNTLFDRTNMKKDAIKTIDNRYSSKRQYSATQQSYVSFFQLAISPARYSKFYTELLENYAKYGLKTMAVTSLGTALNSDFDEDEPYNREDSKDYTVQAFKDMKDAGYSLMTEGANAYTWGYVDHIINVDLDSSRYIKSSASVPFIGVVLHGYLQFAGTPLNEEGDTDYALLRAIENGAGLYFILSYQNTQELKEDVILSQYYSIRYDIWEEDVVKYYKELNAVLADVQNKVIVDHKFLTGKRVLDLDELEADLEQLLKDAEEAEKLKQEAINTENILQVANAWKTAENATAEIKAILAQMAAINEGIQSEDNNDDLMDKLEKMIAGSGTEDAQLEAKVLTHLMALNGMTDENMNPLKPVDTLEALHTQMTSIESVAANILKEYATLESLVEKGEALLDEVLKAYDVIDAAGLDPTVEQNMLKEVTAYYNEAKAIFEDVDTGAEALLDVHKELVDPADATKYVAARAVAALSTYITDATVEDAYVTFKDQLIADTAEKMFTIADIEAEGKLDEELEDDEEDDDAADAYDKYFVDNNQIVVVTYGDRDDTTHEKTEFKTFILNYNNFAVIVEYEHKGEVMTFTIPSGGYVVLYE